VAPSAQPGAAYVQEGLSQSARAKRGPHTRPTARLVHEASRKNS